VVFSIELSVGNNVGTSDSKVWGKHDFERNLTGIDNKEGRNKMGRRIRLSWICWVLVWLVAP
jgi:hypothetical protein